MEKPGILTVQYVKQSLTVQMNDMHAKTLGLKTLSFIALRPRGAPGKLYASQLPLGYMLANLCPLVYAWLTRCSALVSSVCMRVYGALTGDADDAVGLDRAGVAVLERELVAALAEVVLVLVDHDRAADDRVRPDELHELVLDVHLDAAVIRGHVHVAEAAHAALVVLRGAVALTERVEHAAERAARRLRQVAKHIHVQRVLAERQGLERAGDHGLGIFVCLA